MRVRTRVRAALLWGVTAVFAACAGGSERSEGYLHVVVDPIPQCPYGTGYERPLRIELEDRERVVASALTAGMYTGEDALKVSLHVPVAQGGRYRLRFGRCPSMLDDPLGSVACEDVEWVDRMTLRLEPGGIGTPRIVRPVHLRARCIDPSGR